MISVRLPILALAAAFSVLPEGAEAQQADTAAVTTALWTLCPGARLRVTDASARVHEGRCVRSADGLVVLESPGGESRVPTVEVAGVQSRSTAGIRGALAGGATGVAVGAMFPLRDVGCTAEFCDGGDRRSVPMAAGLLIGTGLGAVLGGSIPIWRRRFP